jgi:hypothetical protein
MVIDFPETQEMQDRKMARVVEWLTGLNPGYTYEIVSQDYIVKNSHLEGIYV